jgi:molybdopterin-containing oxidoreductase family iron-sulfur binding subunit
MNDPKDPIVALKESPLNYSLLGNLNTRPRTTYLGAINNPNPSVKVV